MAKQTLQFLRSAVPSKKPTIPQIELGELSINTYDGRLFMRKSGSTGESIVSFVSYEELTGSLFSGSNSFGNDIANTQTFTGSVGIIGSLVVDSYAKITGSAALQSFINQIGSTITVNPISLLIQPTELVNTTGSGITSYGIVSSNSSKAASAANVQVIGGHFNARPYGTSTGYVIGTGIQSYAIRNNASDTSTNATNQLVGANIQAGHQTSVGSTISTTSVIGILNTVLGHKGNITTLTAQQNSATIATSANNTSTVNTFYGLRTSATVGATTGTGSATITNYYDLYLEGAIIRETGVVTNKWGVYQLNASHSNYFAGNIGIGKIASSSLDVSGSAVITGSLNVTGGITGSLQGTATTASYAATSSYADNFTVGNTLTAQRIVVQTVSSSIVYSSGSNIFGSLLTNTHQFTGSVGITGSLSVNNNLLVTGSVTAAGAIARSTYINPTLIASANNDVLVGLDIQPTFTNGGFTGVINNALRFSGTSNNILNSLGDLYFQRAGLSGLQILSTNTHLRSINTTTYLSLGISTTECLKIFPGGNTVIQNGGTFTDAGYRLDVVGTARIGTSLNIGGSTTNASAILQVDSTTKGILFPRMTTTQKNAIASPTSGLVIYDTSLNKLCVYTTSWETITSG